MNERYNISNNLIIILENDIDLTVSLSDYLKKYFKIIYMPVLDEIEEIISQRPVTWILYANDSSVETFLSIHKSSHRKKGVKTIGFVDFDAPVNNQLSPMNFTIPYSKSSIDQAVEECLKLMMERHQV